jgi:DNA-binding MarR family transcriptional regulator
MSRGSFVTRDGVAPVEAAPAALPSGCTSFRLRRVSRRVSQHFDRFLAPCGLKTTQYSLLSHIERLGPIAPGALARRMAMEPSTLTRNLKPALTQGWAEIGPGADGRSRVVYATEAGRAKRAEAARLWKKAQLTLNARLGVERVVELHQLLDDCLARMEAAHGGEPCR